MVVASLCHDIGKAVSVLNHPRIAAEILRPYVRHEVTDGDRGPPGLPGTPLLRAPGPGPRRPPAYRDQPWYELAERFADEWDQNSFDPDYPTRALEHFEPMVREVFAGTPQPL